MRIIFIILGCIFGVLFSHALVKAGFNDSTILKDSAYILFFLAAATILVTHYVRKRKSK